MMQIQMPTLAGRFALCVNCRTEPRHIAHHGRSLCETMQAEVPAVRQSLECRCGRSTGLNASLAGAKTEWGQRFGQFALALPAAVYLSRRHRTSAKETAHA